MVDTTGSELRTMALPTSPQPPVLRVITRAGLSRGANPYNWLLYSHIATAGGVLVEEYSWKRVLTGRQNIWHLHWPDAHLNDRNFALVVRRSATVLALLRWARARGTKILWTIHNLHSHEQYYPALERMFWRGFIQLVDGHISLSKSGQEAALTRFPRLRRLPGFVIPHGHYRDCYPNELTKPAARGILKIGSEARVLTFVGQIRRYKNIPRLIASFRALTDPDLVLLVAGVCSDPELADRVRAEASGDPRIHLELQWLADEQIPLYLKAADLVVLPYNEVLNSGGALLALSFDRPVLVPALGSLAELQQLVGAAWLRTYVGELTPGHLEEALRWSLNTARPSRAPLDTVEWDRIARATVEAYRSLIA